MSTSNLGCSPAGDSGGAEASSSESESCFFFFFFFFFFPSSSLSLSLHPQPTSVRDVHAVSSAPTRDTHHSASSPTPRLEPRRAQHVRPLGSRQTARIW
eukprot:2558135-Rhodomonas_salina.2